MSPKSFVFMQYITTIFDNIKEAVVLLSVEENQKFRLVLANNPFHTITGYQQDTVGKELSEFVPLNLVKPLEKIFSKVVKTKQPFSFMTWAEVPLGNRAYELDVIPVFSTVNEVVQMLVLARDVTEVTRLREEVAELRESHLLKDA